MRYLFYHKSMPDSLLLRVRESKDRILPDEVVNPFKAEVGSPGRILGYNEPPEWVCAHVVITDSISDAGIDAALSHVLGLTNDPRGTTVIDMLNDILGPGVKDITDQAAIEEADRLMAQYGVDNE